MPSRGFLFVHGGDMNLTELQNNLASSDPSVATDAEQTLLTVARVTFPAPFEKLDDAQLLAYYEAALDKRDDDVDTNWLRTWYVQRLLNDRQCDGSTPKPETKVGALLVFLADEVSRWTARSGRYSVRILDALTEIVCCLRRQEDNGIPLDLRRIEHLAIEICVDLELATGDESVLLRFGRALKNVKSVPDTVVDPR
jgi:hypothetical protein